jgi:pimeloyl-ACP methyl ester carboxylesterase
MPNIQSGQLNTYYEQTGRGEALLFIHGLGSSAGGWWNQTPAFSNTYRVIVYDLRGHGRSSRPPGPYSISQFAGDAAALLRALDTGAAHVVGLSLGGAIAFQLALDAPELVRSLTIVNSAPGLELRTLGERLRWRSAVTTRMLLARVLSMRRLGNVIGRGLFPAPEQAAMRTAFVEEFATNDRRTYLAAARALFAWNVVDRVAQIACPTLIISAEHDYTPVEMKQRYVARMPNAVLQVIRDSRHATPVDQPERFNATLRAFLDSLAAPDKLDLAAPAAT